MKKLIYILIVILLTCQYKIVAQHVLKDENDVKWYKSNHQEKIFVHFNTSLLFTGEYLYYKLYCINSNSKKLSKTSKIGYVELLGENGVTVFKHKINLENGLGQGDFFVPTSIPSGNYKLLAYTQWMKNGTKNNFFNSDIGIINPYRGNQRNVISEIDNNSSIPQNILSKAKVIKSRNIDRLITKEIVIKPNSKVYDKRSKISIDIVSLVGAKSFGNYSISIKKIDSIQEQDRPTAYNYSNLYGRNENENKTINDYVYMPEFKGEMITGKVISKKTGNPVEGKNIAISIVGNESVLDITTTNENGIFFFHLKSGYIGDNAIFQIVGDYPNEFEIQLDEHESIDFNDLKFNQMKINSKIEKLILERSVYNQIQNAFFSVKPDTIKTIMPEAPFYGNHQDVYNLDDYTRFPTVNETVIEIIEHAWTRKNDKGFRELVVRGREFDPYFGSELAPLVLVDGIFVQNHEKIIAYKTNKVKSISVLRDEYYYGDIVYKGVISIKTIKGEFNKEFNEPYLKKLQMFKPRPKKNYFNQNYNEGSSNEMKRIPDFRQQILWVPEFEFDENIKTLECYSSDVDGVFEISLEGFTHLGKPISVKEKIKIN